MRSGGEAAVVSWLHLGESLGATGHRDDDVVECCVGTIVDVDGYVGRGSETPKPEDAAEECYWNRDNYGKDV